MNLSRLRTGRRSTCEPGRNALTPPRMVTERPPFTRWLMVPSMSSSRSHALGDLVPHLQLVGLLLGEDAQAVVVLAALEEDVDLVAGLDRDVAVGAGELLERDLAFGLVADVDDDVILVQLDDAAVDDVAFFDLFLA